MRPKEKIRNVDIIGLDDIFLGDKLPLKEHPVAFRPARGAERGAVSTNTLNIVLAIRQ